METLVDSRPEAGTPPPAPPAWYRRTAPIAAAIFVIYALLSLAVDPRGHLSTDVGGKTVSIDAMIATGTWDPDIGHWFETQDPDGHFHAFAHTAQSTNGTWINTTSLTMIYAARPLWAVGGARAILLLPMLGSLAAAWAARSLHRRLRPDEDGSRSMWLVGLASPALVYALDVWEHSWGLALMTWGIVGVMDTVRTGRLAPAIGAGLGYGLAATMRQEALVYGFVAGLVLVGALAIQRRFADAISRGIAMAAAALVPLALHTALEVVVLGGSARASRGASTLGSAGTDVADRVLSVLGTTVFSMSSTSPISWLLSGLLVGSMSALAISLYRRPTDTPEAMVRFVVVAWTLWAVLFVFLGLGFVPGLAIAGPAAIFGLTGMVKERWWLAGLLGVGPLPIVAATAFAAGAFPQWGGRYILTSGLVLTVMGVAWLGGRSTVALRVVMATSILVTALGAAWTIERTNEIGDAGDRIAALTAPEDIVVWRSPFKAREFGELANGRRWLSAPYAPDRDALGPLLLDVEVDAFHWISNPAIDAHFPGWTRTETVDELSFLNVQVVRFERADR